MIPKEIRNIIIYLFNSPKYEISFNTANVDGNTYDCVNIKSKTLESDEYLLTLEDILFNFLNRLKISSGINDAIVSSNFYEDSEEYNFLINFEREISLKYGNNIHTQIECDNGCEKTLHIVSKNIESNSLLNDLRDKFIKEIVNRKYFSLYCAIQYFWEEQMQNENNSSRGLCSSCKYFDYKDSFCEILRRSGVTNQITCVYFKSK